MVLTSAQYKRHEDQLEDSEFGEEVDLTPNSRHHSGNGGGGRGHHHPNNFRDAAATANSIIRGFSTVPTSDSALDLSVANSDALCANAGGGVEAGDGGTVRFVDSTIRYDLQGVSFWHSRTKFERLLIALTSALALFCATLLLIVFNSVLPQIDPSEGISHAGRATQHPCLTPECVKVASRIISIANLSLDPCEDFYSYACSNWETVHPTPDGKPSWSWFEQLWEGNQLIMKRAVEEYHKEDDRSDFKPIYTKVKDYYDTCMDLDGELEKQRGKPLLDLLYTIEMAGPPLLDPDKVVTVQNLETFQTKLEHVQLKLHAPGFFSWMIGEDEKNSSRHVIQIDQGGLSLPSKSDYNFSDPATAAIKEGFQDLIFTTAKKLILDHEEKTTSLSAEREASVREMADGIIEFERRISEFTLSEEELRNLSTSSEGPDGGDDYNVLTLTELNLLAGFMNWTHYFESAFSVIDRPITNETTVVIYGKTFLIGLTDLITEYLNDTQKQIHLENYMAFQLIETYRIALSKDYREAGKALQRAISGKESHPERWRTCISDTDTVLGFALGAMFIRKSGVDSGHLITEAQTMVDNIKTMFMERLKEVPWMDETTRQHALNKASHISDMIGYPEYENVPADLIDKYKGFKVNEGKYFDNNRNFHKYALKEVLERLDKPVNKTKWSMTPPTINAYYAPSKNQIVIPAGILQPPFFSSGDPSSVNYGAIGVVIGHELAHAFDDRGREFDEIGNKRDWWENNTLSEFKRRSQCFDDQYTGYKEDFGKNDSQHLSGKQTLGENIADNGGVRIAFRAYKRWMEISKKNHISQRSSHPLPGLNLGHDKLFFVSFAQVWCSQQTLQSKRQQINDDPHSPAKFRVLGALSNSKEFADAFGCKPGEPMNPEREKCEIW